MNKQKYMAELAGLLSFLTEADRSTVISYYERRFEAAGEAGETELIAQLGTPMRLAIDINRLGLEEMLKEIPEQEEGEEEAEELTCVENEAAQPDPAEDPAAEEENEVEDAEEKAEAAPKIPSEEKEQEEAPDTDEEVDTAQLIAAVLAEPDPEPEKDETEESQVTDEIEELPLPAEDENAAEEPAEEAKAEPGPEHTHHESFPELTVAKGKTIPDGEKQPETKLSILGAIGFFILAIVPGLPLMAVSIVLLPLLLVPGIVLGWCGAVAGVAGFKCLVYIPDAMFMFGAALVLLGLAVLLLVLALWMDKSIICAWKNGVPGLWRRMARKERA